jgi:hypothetical protein
LIKILDSLSFLLMPLPSPADIVLAMTPAFTGNLVAAFGPNLTGDVVEAIGPDGVGKLVEVSWIATARFCSHCDLATPVWRVARQLGRVCLVCLASAWSTAAHSEGTAMLEHSSSLLGLD